MQLVSFTSQALMETSFLSACLLQAFVLLAFPKPSEFTWQRFPTIPVFSLDLFGFERQKRGFLQQVGQILS